MRKYLFLLALPVLFLSCSSREVTEKDKTLLFTMTDFSRLSSISYEKEGCEKYESTNIFGLVKLDYTFDSSQNENNEDFLYFTSGIIFSPSEAGSKSFFTSFINSYELGLKIGGSKVKVEPVENMVDWGEENHFTNILTEEGNITGNYFITRYKNIAFHFTIIGLYFDDNGILNTYFKDKIDTLKAIADGDEGGEEESAAE
ncbi:MAG: hypothetical protein JW969_04890 [Spirochaetales bacterium]|nr:hypothetical protein [Spirochaetales bacterium]